MFSMIKESCGSYKDKMKFQKDHLSFQRASADPGPEGNQQNLKELQRTKGAPNTQLFTEF